MRSIMLALGTSLGILFLAASCSTFRYIAPRVYTIPTPKTDRIPLRIGLYIPPEVRYYTIRETERGFTWHFQIGESLSDGIERMLRKVFEDVVMLQSSDFDMARDGIRAVVVPEVVSGDFRLSAVAFGEGTGFIIRVKYTSMDSAKKALWVDTFEGKSRMRQSVTGVYKECMRLGLEDHFRNALEGMLLSKWWESIM